MAALVGLLVACNRSAHVDPPQPDCTPEWSGDLCAAQGRVCGALTATDRCGTVREIGSCGSCPAGARCTDEGTCESCTATVSDREFCDRIMAACGSYPVQDACGEWRTVACGDCPAPFFCAEEGRCEPEPDEELCADRGRNCGWLKTYDRCNVWREVRSCGACEDPLVCTSSHHCEISDVAFCLAHGRDCGSATGLDSTGAPRSVLNCGTCSVFEECNADGRCERRGASCASPIWIALQSSSGQASARVDNVVDWSDYGQDGLCAGPSPDGDVVFAFALDRAALVEATLTAQNGFSSTLPSGFIRSGCDVPETEVACAQALSGRTARLASHLDPGLWFIWLDGVDTLASGPITLGLAVYDSSPLENDRCDSASIISLEAAPSTLSISGTTLGARADGPSCTGNAPHDLVYRIRLADSADLSMSLAPADWRGQLAVQAGCVEDPDETPLACAAGNKPGEAVPLTLRRLAAGDYSLWVGGLESNQQGSFQLTLDLQPASTPPVNDGCAGATAILQIGSTELLNGDTRIANDDYASLCGDGGGSPDVVYRFHLYKPSLVAAAVTPSSSTPSFRPVVALRSSCEDAAAEVACKAERVGTAVTAIAPELPPGDYFLIVDGSAGSAGEYSLSARVGPPQANQGCGNARELVLDAVTGAATVSGDTRGLTSQYGSSQVCTTGSSGDLTYYFTTTSTSDLTITATPGALSRLAPLLMLHSSCHATQAEVACADGTPGSATTLRVPSLPAGTWYLFLGGSDDGVGPFDLTLSSAPPSPAPVNDTCAAAELLAFDSVTGSASVTRTLDGAADDYRASCDRLTRPGPDIVFAFDLTASTPTTVLTTVAATAVNGLSHPILEVFSACSGQALSGTVACDAFAPSGTATLVARSLTAGRYFVVVDSGSMTAGAFTLTLQQSPALPDTCNSAASIVVTPSQPAVVTGDLGLSSDDWAPSCGVLGGGDLVYRFTTTETYNLSALLTWANPNIQPALSLTRACPAAARGDEVACAAAPYFVLTPSLETEIHLLPAGTWYLWVDAWAQLLDGSFALTVTAAVPPPAPSNETCATATALNVSHNRASVSGDLRGAADDLWSTCGGAGGGDVVYQVTIPSGAPAVDLLANVTARGGTSPAFEPALSIRSGCTAGGGPSPTSQELDCDAGARVAAAAVSSAAPGSTYYLIVDSSSGASGEFDLEVTLSPPATSLPDACASALLVSLNASDRFVYRGDTASAADDAKPLGCATTTGTYADLVFKIDTTGMGARDLIAAVVFAPPYFSVPVVFLWDACPAVTRVHELDCATGLTTSPYSHSATLIHRVLAEGVYYLWIKSYYYANTKFTLDLLLPPSPGRPSNDACAGATELDLSSGSATAAGEFTWATNDAHDLNGAGIGPDVVFRFTLSAAKSLTATLTATQTGAVAFGPLLYLRRDCDVPDASNQIAASAPVGTSLPAVATARVNALPAGTYYLWVDSNAARSEGTFALAVTADAPVASSPANENCATATALGSLAADSTTTVSATTVGAQPDGLLACGADGAPDVVYSFTTAQPQTIEVWAQATSSGGYLPAIALRADDCFGSEQCGAAASAAKPAAAFLKSASAGTYFVWVASGDVYSQPSAGSFELRIELSSPSSHAANDTCAGAIALARGVPQRGSTVRASNDYSGTLPANCGSVSLAGPDVVYAYSPAADGPFEVVVDGGFIAWVAEAANCGPPASCIGFAGRGLNGEARATLVGVAGQTYSIIVDSGSLSRTGPFTVEVL